MYQPPQQTFAQNAQSKRFAMKKEEKKIEELVLFHRRSGGQ
jgi:hypothetical protein